MPDLAAHFAYAEATIIEARAAPLSIRKAHLAALLLDALVDRLYTADPTLAEDILAHRNAMAEHKDLALIMQLAESPQSSLPPRPKGGEGGPARSAGGWGGPLALKVETIPLTPAAYPALTEPEYMVSLYNDATIPRLMLTAKNKSEDAHHVLASAFSYLKEVAATRLQPSSASPPR